MKHKKQSSILWIESIGFSILIVMSWLTEAVRIPHLVFGESFTPNWERALLRTVVISLVWLSVYLATRRLLKRLYYLEEFLRICSWCRKVGHEGEWLEIEKFFDSKFATTTSHGMCPACLQKRLSEINELGQAPTDAAK